MMKRDVRVRVHEEIRVEMYKEGKNDGERARERGKQAGGCMHGGGSEGEM